jgi:hypothetical protein
MAFASRLAGMALPDDVVSSFLFDDIKNRGIAHRFNHYFFFEVGKNIL